MWHPQRTLKFSSSDVTLTIMYTKSLILNRGKYLDYLKEVILTTKLRRWLVNYLYWSGWTRQLLSSCREVHLLFQEVGHVAVLGRHSLRNSQLGHGLEVWQKVLWLKSHHTYAPYAFWRIYDRLSLLTKIILDLFNVFTFFQEFSPMIIVLSKLTALTF